MNRAYKKRCYSVWDGGEEQVGAAPSALLWPGFDSGL